MEQEGIRINKFLSELGVCSRREADKWVESGRILVNNKKPTAGTRVTSKDQVRIDGRIVTSGKEEHVYLAVNKPVGIVSTTDATDPDNIVEFVNFPRRVFPIGRLDKLSEGLIFMTSDGDIVNKILRAGNEHEKEYDVTVDKPVTTDFIAKMAGGVPIMGTMTKKCKVEQTGPFGFKIVLVQGMNRQIRRMCEHFGYDVRKLKRIRIMNIKLDIPSGQWRELLPEEVAEINRLTVNSSKTKAEKKPSSKPAGSSAPKKPAHSSPTSNPDRRPSAAAKGKKPAGKPTGKPTSKPASRPSTRGKGPKSLAKQSGNSGRRKSR